MNKQKPTRILTGKLVAFAATGAYFAVLFVGGLINSGKSSVLSPDFIIYFNPLTYTLALLVVFGLLLAYGSISKPMVYRFAWLAAMAYALRTVITGQSYYLTFAMCGLMAIMTVCVGRALRAEPVKARNSTRADMSPTVGKITVAAVAVLAGGGALFILISTYLAYATPPQMSTGVYIQLMESLRSGRFFDTTLEFGSVVSHWGVHISPIFFVYLPFYAILPSPITLMVLQTAAVFSSVIPLWLIARRRGLSVRITVLLCGLLCLFPAVFGGAAASIHEYALLLPLLLWLMWSFESKKRWLVWIFAGLALCVRETVAIHLLTVGLYQWITHRSDSGRSVRRQGQILAGVSAVYFIGAMLLLTYAGEGTLITRFANLTGKYATDFGTLIREIVFNPALTAFEMLAEAKLHYVLCMILPLGLLPFFTKRRAALVFLIPFLLLNLLSDTYFHYSLDFPYSFGMAAFLFHLVAVVLGDRATERAPVRAFSVRRVLALAATFTLILAGFRLTDVTLFATYAVTERAEIEAMDKLIDTYVPADATVSASARLSPNLATRERIYALSAKRETDIVVIDLRDEMGLEAEKDYTVAYYEARGYKVIARHADVGVVLGRK